MILEELTYGEYANEFKQIFKPQQLILSTLNILAAEYIEYFIKNTFGIYRDKQNVKLLGTSKILRHHYWLKTLALRIENDFT